MIKKYYVLTTTAIKCSLVYKTKLIFYALIGLTQFLIYYFLWDSSFQNTMIINGYRKEGMITYLILSFLIQGILAKWIAMDIGWKNKNGNIIVELLRPVRLQVYFLFFSLGDVMFTWIFMGLPIFILALCSHSLLPSSNLVLFFVSILIAFLIAYFLFFLIGLISFWTRNIWGIFLTYKTVYLFFSGTLMPIEFYPASVAKVAELIYK